MPVNQNTELSNAHCFVTAKTGGGKSQYMKNELIPKRGARVLFWDVDSDHLCTHYKDKEQFLKAVERERYNDSFRIGWAGDDSQEAFVWFCLVAWRILDGNKTTYIVLEELADLEMGQKTLPKLGTLLKRGRKYGARVIANTQRIQEVPKALITQASQVFIGKQSAHDAKYLERLTGLKAGEIERLPELSFYTQRSDTWVKVKTQYRKAANSR